MPVDENNSDASDDDNEKNSDSEESHNDKIPFEDAYHPKAHPSSTTPSQQRVYNLCGEN